MKEIYKVGDNIFYHAIWQDRSATQKFKHTIILPKNTYSPWVNDEEFINIYTIISNEYTLVDKLRCYEIWKLSKQLSKLKGSIIEIGVWRGGTGLLLAKASPNNIVYLCDTFEGVVKASLKDSVYKGGEHSDTSENIVTDLFNKLNATNFEIVKGIFPECATAKIENDSYKICHIDVDVYQSAKDIFYWVWPKMISGGIVIFDDYGFAACEGITELVNEISETLDDSLFIYNINGHGIIIKR